MLYCYYLYHYCHHHQLLIDGALDGNNVSNLLLLWPLHYHNAANLTDLINSDLHQTDADNFPLIRLHLYHHLVGNALLRTTLRILRGMCALLLRRILRHLHKLDARLRPMRNAIRIGGGNQKVNIKVMMSRTLSRPSIAEHAKINRCRAVRDVTLVSTALRSSLYYRGYYYIIGTEDASPLLIGS